MEIGKIRSAFEAGGCLADEAKNVALTVAKICPKLLGVMNFFGVGVYLLAYCPSNPVWSKLSNCRINVPGLANSGMNRVTSLRYVQMIPSPRVGSGVEVLQTESESALILLIGEYGFRKFPTFYILKCENPKTIELSLFLSYSSILGTSRNNIPHSRSLSYSDLCQPMIPVVHNPSGGFKGRDFM